MLITSSLTTGQQHGLYFLPELAILIAVSCMSDGWLIIHQLINQGQYSPSMTNGIIMFVGGIAALATSFIVENPDYYITELVPFSTLLVLIIVVSNLLCHNLYGALLRIYTPTMLSFTDLGG